MRLKKFLDSRGVWCERIYHENRKNWKTIKLYNMAHDKGDIKTFNAISGYINSHWKEKSKGKVTWHTTSGLCKRTGHNTWSLVFRCYRD